MRGSHTGQFLHPYLFNINSNMLLFADDSILSYNYSDPRTTEIIINNDLEQISKLSKQWYVEFNPFTTIFINLSLL